MITPEEIGKILDGAIAAMQQSARHIVEQDDVISSLKAQLSAAVSRGDDAGLHLRWNDDDGQYEDDRCGCAYHPDDHNMTHGGAPHVHRCPPHEREAARRGAD